MRVVDKEKLMNIIFVCHGNICRSVMAEFVFKDMLQSANLNKKFGEICVFSRATSREAIGEDIYPATKQILLRENIKFGVHSARQISRDEFEKADLILCMDRLNLTNLARHFGDFSDEKVKLLLDFSDNFSGEIADPYYTRDFETTFLQIKSGCIGLIKSLNLI